MPPTPFVVPAKSWEFTWEVFLFAHREVAKICKSDAWKSRVERVVRLRARRADSPSTAAKIQAKNLGSAGRQAAAGRENWGAGGGEMPCAGGGGCDILPAVWPLLSRVRRRTRLPATVRRRC